MSNNFQSFLLWSSEKKNLYKINKDVIVAGVANRTEVSYN